jgi:hypothetical protein
MADNAPEPSFVMDDLDLSLNSLPLDMTGEVPLRVTAGVGATGTYTLDFENLAVLTGTCMYLEDKHTGVFTDPSFLMDKGGIAAALVSVYEYGNPITAAIEITQQNYELTDVFNLALSSTKKISLNDGDTLSLGADQANICLYNLAPNSGFEGSKNNPPLGNGVYVTCRALMKFDYSQYLYKANPNYTKPTFEILYNDIFCNFYMLYPAMVEQLNFKDFNSWENAIVAGRLEKVVQLYMFEQPWYMP